MRVSLLSAVAALTLAAPLSAQEAAAPTDKASVTRTSKSDELDAKTRALDGFFACLVKRNPEASAQVLAIPADKSESGAAIGKLVRAEDGPSCLTGVGGFRLGAQKDFYRAGLARAVYLRKFDAAPLVLLPVAETLAGVPSQPNPMRSFAACLVDGDLPSADALIRSRAGSPEEMNAIRALQPAMPGCVDDKARVALTRQSLRAGVAEALYERVTALTETTSGPN
ncbi:MAG: hypothetical protein INF91_02945 [Alphaproteobacteria bacterium]|nr:hypothetical protein [Alphaproteobacteria bacterium]